MSGLIDANSGACTPRRPKDTNVFRHGLLTCLSHSADSAGATTSAGSRPRPLDRAGAGDRR